MTDKWIQLAFEGKIQSLIKVLIGLPQGSPASPILFLLYVVEILANKGYQLSYINDFQITISSTSVFKNYKTLEEILKLLFNQTQDKGIEFDSDKTELIHFHTHKEEIITPITVVEK